MKFLAIEYDCQTIAGKRPDQQLFIEEARRVYELYLAGKLREIYFNELKNAVLILECASQEEAAELINTLPLVKHGLIRFECMQLHPYTGYERMFGNIVSQI